MYLLLKSSDFVAHDTDPSRVYEHVEDEDQGDWKLELVLKKWYDMNPSREFRCFVRDNVLLGEFMSLGVLTSGITQRDTNFYEHLQKPETLFLIRATISDLWEEEIKGDYDGGRDCKRLLASHADRQMSSTCTSLRTSNLVTLSIFSLIHRRPMLYCSRTKNYSRISSR